MSEGWLIQGPPAFPVGDPRLTLYFLAAAILIDFWVLLAVQWPGRARRSPLRAVAVIPLLVLLAGVIPRELPSGLLVFLPLVLSWALVTRICRSGRRGVALWAPAMWLAWGGILGGAVLAADWYGWLADRPGLYLWFWGMVPAWFPADPFLGGALEQALIAVQRVFPGVALGAIPWLLHAVAFRWRPSTRAPVPVWQTGTHCVAVVLLLTGLAAGAALAPVSSGPMRLLDVQAVPAAMTYFISLLLVRLPWRFLGPLLLFCIWMPPQWSLRLLTGLGLGVALLWPIARNVTFQLPQSWPRRRPGRVHWLLAGLAWFGLLLSAQRWGPTPEAAGARVDAAPAHCARADWLPLPGGGELACRATRIRGGVEAAVAACEARGARVCTAREWQAACAGPEGYLWPWGNQPQPDERWHCPLAVALEPQRPWLAACASAGGADDMGITVPQWVQVADGRWALKGFAEPAYHGQLCASRLVWNRPESLSRLQVPGEAVRCCRDPAGEP